MLLHELSSASAATILHDVGCVSNNLPHMRPHLKMRLSLFTNMTKQQLNELYPSNAGQQQYYSNTGAKMVTEPKASSSSTSTSSDDSNDDDDSSFSEEDEQLSQVPPPHLEFDSAAPPHMLCIFK
eukprot:4025200-Ditylum_brightwellii.AAC.1